MLKMQCFQLAAMVVHVNSIPIPWVEERVKSESSDTVHPDTKSGVAKSNVV